MVLFLCKKVHKTGGNRDFRIEKGIVSWESVIEKRLKCVYNGIMEG